MDRAAVVKVGAAASASVCALFGGVVLAQYIVAKKKRAGKKTRIIEMVSATRRCRKRSGQTFTIKLHTRSQPMCELSFSVFRKSTSVIKLHKMVKGGLLKFNKT